MSKRLQEKAGLIQLPALKPATPEAAPAEAARPRTAPGSMMHFIATQSPAVQEVESLRDRVAAFDGANPTRRLDPRLIRPSRWANRHEKAFASPAFVALKAEIEAAGGNVQAIKVRPLPAPAREGVGPSNPPAAEYEVVFGHRRHRACLDLGLPVLAEIEPVSDQALFVQMERENRQRADLSAWEQGTMYLRALESGLYSSNRQLANAIGRDLGDVGKALALARLPQVVVEAFASPLDLQFRWAKPLADAQQKDPEALISRAKALKQRGVVLPARAVLDHLTGVTKPMVEDRQPPDRALKVGGKSAGLVSADAKGRTLIRIDSALDAGRRQALVELIEGFLAR